MSSTTKDLTERAKYLRNAAPQQYEQFLEELRNYAARVGNILIFTDGDAKLAQGHAQQCLKIIEALEEVNKHG